jgi:membrane-bound lysozyme inhibitor of c-type lysozyme MliC
MRALPAFSILLLAGCAGHHEAAGPAGISYACGDGRPARIVYEGGGWHPRARAHLLFDGRTIALAATPPTRGLRYVSDEPDGAAPMLWEAWGEEARLSQLTGADAWTELARCTRLRDGGEEAAHPPDHAPDEAEHH